jgi:hypothetical protein
VGPEPMMATLATGNADTSPLKWPWRLALATGPYLFEFCGSTRHIRECQFRD